MGSVLEGEGIVSNLDQQRDTIESPNNTRRMETILRVENRGRGTTIKNKLFNQKANKRMCISCNLILLWCKFLNLAIPGIERHVSLKSYFYLFKIIFS